ncbi:MAG: DUF3185 family protein [Sedimentisphaerales bacterium]
MNKLISLAILAGGVVLVVFGVSVTKSFSSDLSRFSPAHLPTRRYGC